MSPDERRRFDERQSNRLNKKLREESQWLHDVHLLDCTEERNESRMNLCATAPVAQFISDAANIEPSLEE